MRSLAFWGFHSGDPFLAPCILLVRYISDLSVDNGHRLQFKPCIYTPSSEAVSSRQRIVAALPVGAGGIWSLAWRLQATATTRHARAVDNAAPCVSSQKHCPLTFVSRMNSGPLAFEKLRDSAGGGHAAGSGYPD